MCATWLHPELERLVREKGWRGLTELQQRSAEAIVAGNNVLIVAPTGEGKTEAAILPLLSMIAREGAEPVSILYVTPMRSLINDLYRRLTFWARPLGLRVAKKHGDVPGGERSQRLKEPPHVLLTTPESLEIDLDWAPKFREYYRNLRAVVVDEVHELLSSKRGAQLLMLLERLSAMAGDFQRVALSATVADPARMLELMSGSSRRGRVVINVGTKRNYELTVKYVRESNDFWKDLAGLIQSESEGPTLVFTNSRYTAEKLSHEVQRSGHGAVLVHHSSLSADIREDVERRLREGNKLVVICTRTLELGIDIGSVRKVLQVRAPGSVSSLLQRVGRSYHRLGGTSRGTIIAVGPIDFAEAVAETNLALKGYLEDEGLREIPIDVLAKEVVGMSMSRSEYSSVASVREILGKLRRLGVIDEKLEGLLKYLESNGILVDEDGRLRLGPTFFKIWRFRGRSEDSWAPRDFSEFFSTIPRRDLFAVRSGSADIGFIDSQFVYRSLRPGDRIRLAGRAWEVTRIDEYQQRVEVVPVEGAAEVPLWRGEGSKRSKEVAVEFLNVVAGREGCLATCDREGLKELESIGEWYRSRHVGLGPETLIVEELNGEQVLVYPFGSKVAETVALALLAKAMKDHGLDAGYRSTFFGLSVRPFNGNVIDYLASLDSKEELTRVITRILRYLPHFYKEYAEVKYDLGKLGELDEVRDSFLLDEVTRNVLLQELDIDGAWHFIENLKKGLIAIVRLTEGPSPLAFYVLSSPLVRFWIPDLARRIARALEGWAFTSIELADELSLPERTVLGKLKDMRRPEYNELRVTAFFDLSSGEWRWVLDAELAKVASMEDFSASFRPFSLDKEFRVLVKRAFNLEGKEVIIRPRDVISRWNEIVSLLGSEDVYELRVEPIGDGPSVALYYVSGRSLRLELLNAMAAALARIEARRLTP